jgi:hypothetical protein
MKIDRIDPPREFLVGHPGQEIAIRHGADIHMAPDEQVTLKTESGAEFDIVRKEWGYYATPSLNGRLASFGLRSALVMSGDRRYVLLVEKDKLADFDAYLKKQKMTVVAWLDGPEIEFVGSAAK